MSDIRISSNRSFGIVFFLVFFIITIYSLFNDGDLRIWSLILSILFLVLGLLNSKILTPINKIWFKFGILLGSIVSPIVMAIIFFFVVSPISLLMKTFAGKDILNLKKNDKNTYWIKKSDQKSKMKNQF